MENFILGLTGSFGSGCSTTSDLISSEKDFNFTSFSLSNLLKTEAKKRFPKFNLLENKKRRELLQDLGNTIRKEKTELCRKCGNRLNDDEKICKKCVNNIWEDMPSKILDLCRSVHAEESVILEAGNFGINLKDKILYTTTFPCLLCTKIIITAGIKRIVFIEPYPVIESIEMLKESRILMEKYEGINPRVFLKYFKNFI